MNSSRHGGLFKRVNNFLNTNSERFLIQKDVSLVVLVFTLTFLAFGGLTNLQSSLHTDEGLGTTTQAILYASFMLSCLLLPKLFVSRLGHKWTMVLAITGYVIWDAANGYAVWATMVPSSILAGIAAALLWTSQGAYFNILAERYAKISQEALQAVVTRFTGLIIFSLSISGLFANIISSNILKPEEYNITEDQLRFCGAKDCPNMPVNVTTYNPSDSTVWTLVGIYVGMGILSNLILVMFVNDIPKALFERKKVSLKESMGLALVTVKHLKHTDQILLVPLTIYSGLEFATIFSDFTKSFVTCSAGIWMVGYVLIPFGVILSVCALISGELVKYTGRIPIMTFYFVVNMGNLILHLMWVPRADQEYMLYILSSFWGVAEGIRKTNLRAMYGVLFAKQAEAAFSNYHMWEACGVIIALSYSSQICTSIKFYILIALFCVGALGYYTIEYRQFKSSKVSPTEKSSVISTISVVEY